MSVSADSDVYYDPYDVELNRDPYPAFRRIREEAPLYYNDRHDFFALSRYADVDAALVDFATFSSARGAVLEIIQSGMDIPPGTLIFEDPPIHNIHRKLLSRIFTPRKVSALEPKIREFTARCLDPLIGTGGFDFVKDLGAQMPMRVRGMLASRPPKPMGNSSSGSNFLLMASHNRPRQTSSMWSNTGTPRCGQNAAAR